MSNHAVNLGVDQLLSNDGALLRVGLVVFRDQLELDLGTANFQALRIQFFDGKHGAALVVLAQVSLRASHRRNVAELDDDFRLGFRGGRRGDGGGCFLLTTGGKSEGCCNGKGYYGKLGLHR